MAGTVAFDCTCSPNCMSRAQGAPPSLTAHSTLTTLDWSLVSTQAQPQAKAQT